MAIGNQNRRSIIPPGQPRMEIPNDRILNHAGQYREVVEDLFYRPGGPNPKIAPLLTCCSLALELYLKSLNAENAYEDLVPRYGNLFKGVHKVTARPLSREHTLSRLFFEVGDTTRQELEAAFAGSRRVSDPPTLAAALSGYNRLFVESRYSYEYDQGSLPGPVNDLVRLVSWLGDRIKEMPRRMVLDEVGSNSEPHEYPGRVVGDAVVLDSGATLPDESIVDIRATDGSSHEGGVVEAGSIRLDWPDAYSEGASVGVTVIGRRLPIEDVHPAFRIGDRVVEPDNSNQEGQHPNLAGDRP